LETVDLVDFSGNVGSRWDLLGRERSKVPLREDVDYRTIPDTKPHYRHANHLFIAGGEIFVTQLRSSNALGIVSGRVLDVAVGMPHDGTMQGGRNVFTTTNGHVVEFDIENEQMHRVHDLNAMTPSLNQLGWCRGVARHPTNPARFFVGFSAPRKSAWREFGHWIKHQHSPAPSRIALYDVGERRLVQEWEIGPHPGYILFQLHVLK
jgi:hypothetical protein